MVDLGSHPYLADPDAGLDTAEMTIIVEGEKKAMVTMLTYDTPRVQVVGIPGKKIWRDVAEKVKGQNIVILFDPDATQQAEMMAVAVGGARVVKFPHKIDDTIIKYRLDRPWMQGLFNTARFIK
jgi:hypothetical protein